MQTYHRNGHNDGGNNAKLVSAYDNTGIINIECYIGTMPKNATSGRFVTTMRDPSSKEAASKFAQGAKAFSAKHTTSKESDRAVLSDIGITTKRGKLTKNYQTQKRSA